MTHSFLYRINKTLAIIALLILIIIPLILILIEGFLPTETSTFADNVNRLLSDQNLEILWNSIKLGIAVVILSTIFAFPLSYIMTKTSLSRHQWLDVLIMIPFMTPPYIGAMGWMLTMQHNGLLHQIHPWFELITPYFFSFFGMVLIMSCHLTPFLYVILKNAIKNLQQSQEEVGLLYGGSFFYRLRRLLAPLTVSGYSMGALLVFVKTIGEFGTPVTMGYSIGYYVLTSEIHRAATIWPIDFQRAALLSFLLLSTSMVVWFLQQWFQQRSSHEINRGKGSKIRVLRRSKFDILLYLFVASMLILLIVMPYASIVSSAFMERLSGGFNLDNLTLSNFTEMLSGEGGEALITSLILAIVSATVASIFGIWFVLNSKDKKLSSKVIDFSSLLPNTVPGIIVVIGLILFWNHLWNPIPIYNTIYLLIVTYVVLYIPFAVQNIKNVQSNISSNLLEASEIAGARKFTTFRRVTLPLLIPGILSGWILIFSISMRELVGSLMLRPTNMHTSSTYIYHQFQQGASSHGMAMALLSVGVTTLILVIMEFVERRRQKKFS